MPQSPRLTRSLAVVSFGAIAILPLVFLTAKMPDIRISAALKSLSSRFHPRGGR